MKFFILILALSATHLFAFDENQWRLADGKPERAKWKIELSTFSGTFYAFTDIERDRKLLEVAGKHSYVLTDVSKSFDKDEIAISTSTVSGYKNFSELKKTMTDDAALEEQILLQAELLLRIEKAEQTTGINLTKEKDKIKSKMSHLKKQHDKVK